MGGAISPELGGVGADLLVHRRASARGHRYWLAGRHHPRSVVRLTPRATRAGDGSHRLYRPQAAPADPNVPRVATGGHRLGLASDKPAPGVVG